MNQSKLIHAPLTMSRSDKDQASHVLLGQKLRKVQANVRGEHVSSRVILLAYIVDVEQQALSMGSPNVFLHLRMKTASQAFCPMGHCGIGKI